MHAIAQDGLENLGVNCLLSDDVVDHMGEVTIRWGTDSRYLASTYKCTRAQIVHERYTKEVQS